jgi:uncharacterized membrane protein
MQSLLTTWHRHQIKKLFLSFSLYSIFFLRTDSRTSLLQQVYNNPLTWDGPHTKLCISIIFLSLFTPLKIKERLKIIILLYLYIIFVVNVALSIKLYFRKKKNQ